MIDDDPKDDDVEKTEPATAEAVAGDVPAEVAEEPADDAEATPKRPGRGRGRGVTPVGEETAEAPVAKVSADEPEADAPDAEEPAAEEPAAEEPVADEAEVEQPAAEAPVVEEPEVEEPAAEAPVVEEPVVEEPAPAKPAAAKPPAERPAPAPRRRRDSGERPVVRAHAKYVRTSARKARLVCDHIRGKSVEEARAILALTPRAVAEDWQKLLESAVANAEHNHELVGDDLKIVAVFADEGPTLKRFRPRAMGRATRIRKRTSHLTIQLTPKD
jgi:ribosomal protein L22